MELGSCWYSLEQGEGWRAEQGEGWPAEPELEERRLARHPTP
jgi:hypothetical protein